MPSSGGGNCPARIARVLSGTLSVMRVLAPGEMMFAVTLYRASSFATTRVKPAMASFAAP